MREPDVAGAEGVPHMEKRGDFPEPAITGRASVEMLMPPGIAAQEGPGHVVGAGSDGSQRGKDGFAGAATNGSSNPPVDSVITPAGLSSFS